MPVWAIADLHLAFGVPNKKMDVFGAQWVDYTDKIEKKWRENIAETDLVLIAGDISWAMRLEDAKPDLDWIHSLPGTKVIIRGNHDYWWTSLSKIKQIMPPSVHVVQNNVYNWQGLSVA
jgi:predicted phosphohydrolase